MKADTLQFLNNFYIEIDIHYELAKTVAIIAAKEILKETDDPNRWNNIIKELEA